MARPAQRLPDAEREALQATGRNEEAVRWFRYFAYHAWGLVEPGRQLVWNWHLTLLCDEIQAFTRPLRDPDFEPVHRTLVICVPPRSLKSYLTGVCLQAWLWLYAPWVLMQGISCDEDLSGRDSLRLLELVTSEWYQDLVRYRHQQDGGDPTGPLPWGISKKQARKVNFLNTQAGGRMALGVGSSIIGKGADLQLVDDPLDAKTATRGSPIAVAKRMAEVIDDFDHVWKSRLNEPARSLRMIIMQRLDPGDLAGENIRRSLTDPSIRCVVLPMEYDPEFPEDLGGVHPRDPRTRRGQLLMPRRWSKAVWDAMLAGRAASRHVQAQYNQRPRLAEGKLFRLSMFAQRFVGPPQSLKVDEIAAFVDCSFKKGSDTSYVVIQVWGRVGKARFYMLDQIRVQMSFVETLDALIRTREKWHRLRRIVVEDKANGPAVVDVMKRDVPGVIEWSPGTASKYERAEVGSKPALEANQVWYPEPIYASWLEGYAERHVAFDGAGSVPDDEVDTTSMALLYWTGGRGDPLERLKKRLPSGLLGR